MELQAALHRSFLRGGVWFPLGPRAVSLTRSRLFQKVSVSCLLNESSAKVIYSVAPAMGHNKEAHPECSLRVPAIVTALEKMKLTPKFRGSEIIQLEDFRIATVEDIASVHSKSYVVGLEKAMEKVSEQGFIHIDGSGPTYATATTFQESLIAAGAGLSLVDHVVISQPTTGVVNEPSQAELELGL